MRYDPHAVRRLMDQRGILASQEITRFARRCKMSRGTLLEIRAGRSRPRADILGKLAKGLGVTVLAFYHDGQEESRHAE